MAPPPYRKGVDVYAVWTNKGGVGKTTMTFQTSLEYAFRHPGERVLMIDMCPQANLSGTVLTHMVQTSSLTFTPPQLHRGEGLVAQLTKNMCTTSGTQAGRTVGGLVFYLTQPTAAGPSPPLDWYPVNVQEAIVQYCRHSDPRCRDCKRSSDERASKRPRVSEDGQDKEVARDAQRSSDRDSDSSDEDEPDEPDRECPCKAALHVAPRNLADIGKFRPSNLYLLCGDPGLEDLVGPLHNYAVADGDRGFSIAYNMIGQFIHNLSNMPGWKDQNLTVFIDTNPAMTIYTKMALCASKKLVTICMADDFSKEALRAAASRMFDYTDCDDLNGPDIAAAGYYRNQSLHVKAKQKYTDPMGKEHRIIDLPRMHCLVANRTRVQGSETRAVRAFHKMSSQCYDTFYRFYEAHPEVFQKRTTKLPEGVQKLSKEMFKEGWGQPKSKQRTRYAVSMCDMNQAGVLSSHFGLAFRSMLQEDGEIDPMVKQAFRHFIGSRSAVPTKDTVQNVLTNMKHVVTTITESTKRREQWVVE